MSTGEADEVKARLGEKEEREKGGKEQRRQGLQVIRNKLKRKWC